MRKPMPPVAGHEDRFWAMVDRRGPDECWPWKGARNGGGYAQFRLGGRKPMAHRVAYVIANGTIDPALDVHHECMNTGCCNPAHLLAMSPAENIALSYARNVGATAIRERAATTDRCPAGHLYNDENTKITHRGTRQCRECKRVAERARYQAANPDNRGPREQRTHCPEGHAYSPENTRVDGRNRRSCKTCDRARQRARYAASKAAR